MINYILFVSATIIRLAGFLAAFAIFPVQFHDSAASTFLPIQYDGAEVKSLPLIDPKSGIQIAASTDSTPPVVTVWYGSTQSFTLGAAQNWLNILGNVADPESGIVALSYTLNGSPPRALNIGPDGRRLARPGDFNIDIALTDSALHSDSNTVVIQAVNGAGLSTQSSVQFNYTAGTTWALPYSVIWNSVTNIQQAVQVVDGRWQIVPGGVRSVETGYDRVLAVGDLTWTDYDILVPVTINAIDSTKYGDPIGVDPGIGINLRWLGHTDDPVQCGQPKCGWNPTGASVWYEFFANSSQNNFSMQAYPPYDTPSNPIVFATGARYWIRAHVETNAGGSLYKAKAWVDGSPEPAAWMFSKQTDLTNLTHGSLLLVTHYVDATFGDISVAPVAAKLNQQITVTQHAPASAAYGSSFTVAASSSSGLPVSYSSGSPAVCSNASGGATFTITSGSGTCAVQYNQPGNGSYNAASQVSESAAAQKAGQSISFPSIADKTYGDSAFPAIASASSGLAVAFQTAGNCAVTGNSVSITSAGSCAITASQAGNANYAPAQNVTVTFAIAKAKAILTLSGLFQVYDGSPKTVAVATSPANLTSVTITYNGSVTAPTNAGSYTVAAALANANYDAAPVSGALQIAKAQAALSISNQSFVYDGAPKTVSVTSAPPGLGPISILYNGLSTPPTDAGSYPVTAALTNANYSAPDATGMLQITKAPAAMLFGNLSHIYDGTPKSVTVTINPAGLLGVSVTYNGSSTAPTNAGSYTVTATLVDQNYQAAPVSGILTIAKADQAITVTESAPHYAVTGSQFTVAAMSSAPGLHVIYTSGSPSLCANNGPVFTVTGSSGTCIVLYNQDGNENYNAATPVRQEVLTSQVLVIESQVFLPFMQMP